MMRLKNLTINYFFNYKIDSEKISLNPKIDEINKFLIRYNSARLFLNKRPLYDKSDRNSERLGI